MKKALYIIAMAGSVFYYVNSYNKVYAKSHEKHEAPKFMFPVACHYGQDCWAVRYVDVDPEEGENAAKDFKCGSRTYDGHKGTDFALGSVEHMKNGVNVLAAAAGKVIRFRDGQSDDLKTEKELKDIIDSKKECGNGILLDHGDGLQTIYCQLKKDSIVVKQNQRVKAGQNIAQVGQSGLAKYPHLHFGVFEDGKVLDPYTGALNSEGCRQKENPMWHIGLPMRYEPVAIFDGGFRNKAPDFESIRRGYDINPAFLPLNSSALVFWVGFYNVEAGDKVEINIYDPSGQLFDTSTQTVKKPNIQKYFYTGRKTGDTALIKGIYKARVKFSRFGNQAVSKVKEFSIGVE